MTDVDCCRYIKLDTLRGNLTKFENDRLFMEFLSEGNNKEEFHSMLDTPSMERVLRLDQKFKEFYRRKKILNYLYGMIRRFAIDYDKRVRRRNMKCLLILDKQVENGNDFNKSTLAESLPSNAMTPLEETLINEEELVFENENLRKAYTNLKQKQKEIIKMYYVDGLTNKEIGQRFNKSPQYIQYWHKKSLQQLHKSLIKSDKDVL